VNIALRIGQAPRDVHPVEKCSMPVSALDGAPSPLKLKKGR
jgi:hypothetical protein